MQWWMQKPFSSWYKSTQCFKFLVLLVEGCLYKCKYPVIVDGFLTARWRLLPKLEILSSGMAFLLLHWLSVVLHAISLSSLQSPPKISLCFVFRLHLLEAWLFYSVGESWIHAFEIRKFAISLLPGSFCHTVCLWKAFKMIGSWLYVCRTCYCLAFSSVWREIQRFC